MSQWKTLFKLPHVEPARVRIRALFGGQYIIDTDNAKLVWLKPWYPLYFFDAADVSEKHLTRSPDAAGDKEHEVFDVVVGGKTAQGAAKRYTNGELKGLISIRPLAMDAWFEENEQLLYDHPKDPYKRLDVLQSSRHVRVELNGQVLADTTRPAFLIETGLRRRTYISKADCKMEFLVETQTTTLCPYKGVANYYSVRLPDGTEEKDSVWWYRNANPECIQINGLVAFYDEKLDVYIDGVLQERNLSPFNE